MVKEYQKRFYPEEIDQEVYSQQFDIVVVLGSVMTWSPSMNRWSFPIAIKEYAGHLVMGAYRAFAAAEFQDHTEKLLITGGSDKHPTTGQKHSRSTELTKRIKKLGVPEDKLVDIGQLGSSHTQGNIENTIAFLSQNPELLKERKIGILSPTFQARRAELMWRNSPWFKEEDIEPRLLLLEDILTQKYPSLEKAFEKIYNSQDADHCLTMEQQGIDAFLRSNYGPKNPESTK